MFAPQTPPQHDHPGQHCHRGQEHSCIPSQCVGTEGCSTESQRVDLQSRSHTGTDASHDILTKDMFLAKFLSKHECVYIQPTLPLASRAQIWIVSPVCSLCGRMAVTTLTWSSWRACWGGAAPSLCAWIPCPRWSLRWGRPEGGGRGQAAPSSRRTPPTPYCR